MIQRLLGIETSKYKRMTMDEALAQAGPPTGVLIADHMLSDEEIERLQLDYLDRIKGIGVRG